MNMHDAFYMLFPNAFIWNLLNVILDFSFAPCGDEENPMFEIVLFDQ